MSNNLDVVLAHNLDDSIRTSYFVCYFTRICAFDKPSVANFVRQISSLELNRLIKIEIYSLETRSWKSINEDLIVPYDVGFNNKGVYWNGAIFWYDSNKVVILYLIR